MHFYLDHPYKVQPPPSNSDHQEGISLGRGSQFTTRERVGSTRTSSIFAVLMQRKGCVAILRKNMSLSVTTKGSILEYDPNIPRYKSQSWFSMIRSLSVLTSMTSTGEALKNQTCCLVQDFPTFKRETNKLHQVTLYFLLDGDLHGQHIILIKPTQFQPGNLFHRSNGVMMLMMSLGKKTVKNVNKLFSNNFTQNAPWDWYVYQHFAIKIIYINVGKYIPIPWILLGNNASFQSCTHTYISAPIWDADLGFSHGPLCWWTDSPYIHDGSRGRTCIKIYLTWKP